MQLRLTVILGLLLLCGCRTIGGGSTVSDEPVDLEPREPEDVEVFFHPYPEESTFGPIAELVRDTRFKRIDIAMYSMEVKAEKSEIIVALQEQAERIANGDLQVRVIFQGYSDPCGKCVPLEALGVDVRQIRSKDVHHKFGVFYGDEATAVMTGSGNWSASSNTKYDENMLLFRDHIGLAQEFILEFEKLWAFHEFAWELSEEEQALNEDEDPSNNVWDGYGNDLEIENYDPDYWYYVDPGLSVVFNSANFKLTATNARAVRPRRFTLTRKLVEMIDSAEESILMATPRISLRPVYEALLAAAKRGVKIKIMSSEAEYMHAGRGANRGKLFSCDKDKVMTAAGNVSAAKLKKHYGRCCKKKSGSVVFDRYREQCSTSQNHLKFLHEGVYPEMTEEAPTYPGHENVEVRLKLFTWWPNPQSIDKQMHAKFTIVDNQRVMAGSFNYSFNSEYKLFENAVILDGRRYPQAIGAMIAKFNRIWERNRPEFKAFQAALEQAHAEGNQINCPDIMFSLTYPEIENFLGTADRHESFEKVKDACL